MWLCLTTLHHRRFVEDIVNILALPTGANVQMRYAVRYCDIPFSDSQIFDASRSNQDLEKLGYATDVLIALGYPDQQQDYIIPLRLGSILSFSRSGSLVILDVELREFVSLPLALNDLRGNLETIGYNTVPVGFSPNASKRASGFFIQQLKCFPSCLKRHEKTMEGWEESVESVFRAIRSFNSSCQQGDERKISLSFMHHLEIRTDWMGIAKLTNSTIEVESGVHTEMIIHSMTDQTDPAPIIDPLGEIVVELSNPAISHSTSKRLRVDSRRDSKRLSLMGSANFRSIHGHIALMSVHFYYKDSVELSTTQAQKKIQYKGKDNRIEVVVARADIPLTVGKYVPAIAALSTSLAVAIAGVYGSIDGVIEGGIPSILLGALIFSMTLLGLMLGFRRSN